MWLLLVILHPLHRVPGPGAGSRAASSPPRRAGGGEGRSLTVSSHFGASGHIVQIEDEGCPADTRGLLVV